MKKEILITRAYTWMCQCKISSVQKGSHLEKGNWHFKKGTGPWFEHLDIFHMYIRSEQTNINGRLAMLVVWWSRKQNSRQMMAKNTHDGKIFEMVMHSYHHICWSQMQQLSICLTHRWTRFYHIFRQLVHMFLDVMGEIPLPINHKKSQKEEGGAHTCSPGLSAP